MQIKQMKYSLLITLLVATQLAIAQETFELKGKVSGITTGFIFLNYPNEQGKDIKDSSLVTTGSFSFSGTIAGPTMVSMSYGKPRSVDDLNYVNFFLEPGLITVDISKDKFKDAVITGSKTQLLYRQLEKEKKPIYEKLKEITSEFLSEKEKDKEKAAAILDKRAPYTRQLDSLDYKFFAVHPTSYVTAYMLRYHVGDFSWDKLQDYYDKLGSESQQSRYGKNIKEEIQKLRAGSPGAMANDFSKADINGSSVSLSEFKGKKIVIIDFWASWCVPCRKGNPHLKELYAKYKDKGLEIIGVSDDDNKPENWKKAVDQDALPWRHVLRGLDWEKIRKGEKSENDISEKFGIHELPTKILVDKNGVIIGRYYEYDEELDTKLKEIFGE
jgi:thiol-disulfide isomerase/thioredoxin